MKGLAILGQKAQLAQASQPCQLAACIKELREAMEPLMSFTNEDVFTKELSHWVKVTSSQPSEPTEPEETIWKFSCSRCRIACPWGSFSVMHSIGCSKLTISTMANTLTVPSQRTGTPTVLSQQVKTPPGTPVIPQQMPPSFAEIARSLWGDNTSCITIYLTPELKTSPDLLVGTVMATMTSTWMQQDVVTGVTYVDTVTASMGLASLGSTPMADECPMPTLENLSDSD